jgi:hypothetical protein
MISIVDVDRTNNRGIVNKNDIIQINITTIRTYLVVLIFLVFFIKKNCPLSTHANFELEISVESETKKSYLTKNPSPGYSDYIEKICSHNSCIFHVFQHLFYRCFSYSKYINYNISEILPL